MTVKEEERGCMGTGKLYIQLAIVLKCLYEHSDNLYFTPSKPSLGECLDYVGTRVYLSFTYVRVGLDQCLY